MSKPELHTVPMWPEDAWACESAAALEHPQHTRFETRTAGFWLGPSTSSTDP